MSKLHVQSIAIVVCGTKMARTHQGPVVCFHCRLAREDRATAAAFCYHIGAVASGMVSPVLSWFAVERHMGFAVPMLIGTVGGLVSFVVTLFFSPETKGRAMVGDLSLVPVKEFRQEAMSFRTHIFLCRYRPQTPQAALIYC